VFSACLRGFLIGNRVDYARVWPFKITAPPLTMCNPTFRAVSFLTLRLPARDAHILTILGPMPAVNMLARLQGLVTTDSPVAADRHRASISESVRPAALGPIANITLPAEVRVTAGIP
jgi:hypothetical protein